MLAVAFLCATGVPAASVADQFTGLVGAIDTPSAFGWPTDEVVIGFSYSDTARVLSFGFQATERLQIGLSFPTYVQNGTSSSGNELSLAYRLFDEAQLTPSLSVGLVGVGTDDGGAGEYIVAGKTIGSIDAAFGLGWGRYAQIYDGPRGDDGTDPAEFDHLFSKDATPFANIRWATPIEGLSVLGEYTDIAREGEDATYAAGIAYEVSGGLTFTGYTNNHGESGLRFTFSANPTKPYIQENARRGPHPFVIRPQPASTQAQKPAAQVLKIAQDRLEKDGIRIARSAMYDDTIDVTVSTETDRNLARIAGRVARVLSAVAPASINRFLISQTNGAFDTNVVALDRGGLEQAINQPNGAARAWDAAQIEAVALERPAAVLERTFTSGFSYGLSASLKADFLTSDTLAATGTINASARYAFSGQTSLSTSLAHRFLNQWEQTEPPAEPAVRSDFSAYTPDEIYLNSLLFRHDFRLSSDIYSRVSAGLFERAYGGVSSEVIWRSPARDFALGVEATHVQKRAYDAWLGFEDADATTLIGSVYANIGKRGDFAIINAGQHLAGDFAVELTVGRNFSNGWRVAASTGWSADSDTPLKFGAELRIPLAWTAPVTGTQAVNLSLGGTSGDYGSRVQGTGLIYKEISNSDRQRIEDGWGQFWN
jgi:hypothetical protein